MYNPKNDPKEPMLTLEEVQNNFSKLAHGMIRSAADILNSAAIEIWEPPVAIQVQGWPMFNQLTGGLRMKEFTILCGATGTGKTSFLANLSANLITQRVKHMVASVETGDEDFVRRVMSVLLDKDVNDGTQRNSREVHAWVAQLRPMFEADSLHLSMIDNRMGLGQLLGKLEYSSKVLGCKVALLDNLNFFLDVKASSEQMVEMDRVIHELIMFCKRTEMHIVMVMHPKKTDNGRVESEFDIKGSSTAVQEAHNVFLFNRMRADEKDRSYGPMHRELKAAKLRRRGRYTGGVLVYDGNSPAYREMELR